MEFQTHNHHAQYVVVRNSPQFVTIKNHMRITHFTIKVEAYIYTSMYRVVTVILPLKLKHTHTHLCIELLPDVRLKQNIRFSKEQFETQKEIIP